MEAVRRPSSGEKGVSGAATSNLWEQEATDGTGEDVTLPVRLMK